jgi:hypothetical protein
VSSSLFGRAASVAETLDQIPDPLVIASVDEATAPVERPRTPRKKPAKQVTQEIKLVLPQAVARELKAIAAKRGVTASALATTAFRQAFPSIAEILRAA